jgi:lycopene cyclase domain-containing protein
MHPSWTYFVILGASIAGPLSLSFDKKIAFYKNWKPLFIALIVPTLFFVLWDSWMAYQGVWGFVETRNKGWYIGNLPIEEILFFVLIPYCCVFVYECMVGYFPTIKGRAWGKPVLYTIGILLLIIGLLNLNKSYTRDYALLNAAFIACIYFFPKYFKHFDASAFLISYIVILIPFFIVNGALTYIPVIWYNHTENLNTRIVSIPIEDSYYGMLNIIMVIAFYLKQKAKLVKV